MRTVTIQFEFPDVFDHDEVIDTINGAITDMDSGLASDMTYTIVGRK